MKKLISLFLIFILIFSFCACSQKDKSLKIVTITDPHFTGSEYFSYEGTFAEINDSNGTGKQVKYVETILDAFIEQMLSEKPDYIIITGDLAFDGAKVSHLAVSEKLSALTEAEITVLVIPGNHDITGGAYIFPDGEAQVSESITPEEFREIYSSFGYSGGISYDENSLSYVYDTGKGTQIFMLDTNLMYGASLGQLSSETIEWLKNELELCKEAGNIPLFAGHHSLLSHNPRFDLTYKLSNGDEVAKLLTEYGGNLYLCGHLHTQHYVQSDEMTDIVTGGFCVYPHRYGVIEFFGESWTYESRTTDVAAFAESIGSDNPDLIGYSDYGYNFFYKNAYDQAKGAVSSVISDEELIEKYSDFSAKLNVAYFGGTFSDVDLSYTDEFLAATEGIGWNSYMKSVLLDTKDSVCCQWPLETE